MGRALTSSLVVVAVVVVALAWGLVDDEPEGAGPGAPLTPRVAGSAGSPVEAVGGLRALPDGAVAERLEATGRDPAVGRGERATRPSLGRWDRRDDARWLWDDGEPIAGALIDLHVRGSPFAAPRASDPPPVHTDAEGRTQLEALFAALEHHASVSHPDLLTPAVVSFVADREPGRTVELTVPRPSRVELSGLVWPGDLEVTLRDEDAGRAIAFRRTRAGPLAFDGVPRGRRVAVDVVRGDRELGHGSATVEAPVQELVLEALEVSEQSVTFRWSLVDENGRPLSHSALAEAGIDTRNLALALEPQVGGLERVQLFVSGDRLTGLASSDRPRPWTLSWHVHGHTVELTDYRGDEDAVFRLPPGLLDPLGVWVRFVPGGAASALDEVRLLNAGDVPTGIRRVEDPGDGGFAVRLPPGDYEFEAWGQGWRSVARGRLQLLEAERGATRVVTVRFQEPASLEGRVRVPPEMGLHPVVQGALTARRLELVPLDGVLFAEPRGGSLGSQGAYRVDQVVPGRYAVQVRGEADAEQHAWRLGVVDLPPGLTARDFDLVADRDPVDDDRRLEVVGPGLFQVRLTIHSSAAAPQVFNLFNRRFDSPGVASTVHVPADATRYEAWLGTGGPWLRRRGLLPVDDGPLRLDP